MPEWLSLYPEKHVHTRLLTIINRISRTEGYPLGGISEPREEKTWISSTDFSPRLKVVMDVEYGKTCSRVKNAVLTVVDERDGDTEFAINAEYPPESLDNNQYAQIFMDAFASYEVHEHEVCLRAWTRRILSNPGPVNISRSEIVPVFIREAV